MSKFEKFARGLLEGAGDAAEVVGKSMIDREKAAAAELAARNHARFQSDLAMERTREGWKHDKEVLGEEREYKKGLLEDEREYQEGVAETKRDDALELAEFKSQLTREENEALYNLKMDLEKAKATGGTVDFDSPLYKKALKNVTDGFHQDFISWRKTLPPEEQGMGDFMMMDPTTERMVPDYNKMLEAAPPEMRQKYEGLKDLTEQFVKQGKWPEEAYSAAQKFMTVGQKVQQQKESGDRFGAIAEQTGLKPTELKNIQNKAVTPEIVEQLAKKVAADPEAAAREMFAAKELNNALWKAVGDRVKEMRGQGQKDVPSLKTQREKTERNARTFGTDWWEQGDIL